MIDSFTLRMEPENFKWVEIFDRYEVTEVWQDIDGSVNVKLDKVFTDETGN